MKRFLDNLSPEDRRTHRKWAVSVVVFYTAAIIFALVVSSTLPPNNYAQRDAANVVKAQKPALRQAQ
jgi:hypothetical protein